MLISRLTFELSVERALEPLLQELSLLLFVLALEQLLLILQQLLQQALHSCFELFSVAMDALENCQLFLH